MTASSAGSLILPVKQPKFCLPAVLRAAYFGCATCLAMSRSVRDSDLFRVKWFDPGDGHPPVPICLQGRGGPCPLLALCNTLLLRREVDLPTGIDVVSQEQLLSYIAELPQAAAAEILDALPNLASSVPVDICFSGTTDFAVTSELAIFEAMKIRLVHGAIPDPQDDLLVECISPLSYNQICDQLVRALAATNEVHEPQELDQSASGTAENDVNTKLPDQTLDTWPHLDDTANAPEKDCDYFDEDERTLIVYDLPPHLQESAYNSDSAADTHVDATSTSQPDSTRNHDKSSPPGNCEQTSLIAENALRIQAFLNDFPSMMTYHGLALLHETLHDRELAVLFYNNHFSVLTKRNGRLYSLVTDVGYANHSAVIWEQLCDLDGNSVYCDSAFRPSPKIGAQSSSSSGGRTFPGQTLLGQKAKPASSRDPTASSSALPSSVRRPTEPAGVSPYQSSYERLRSSSQIGRNKYSKSGKGSSGCSLQ